MTRPLALAGLGALGILLLYLCAVPSAALVPLTVLLLMAAVGAALGRYARRARGCGEAREPVWAVLLAMGLALLRLAAQQPTVARVQALADGRPHTLEGAVLETGSGLYEGVYRASLRVTAVDGQPCAPFMTVCSNLETVQAGRQLRLTAELEPVGASYRLQQYADGVYVQALQTQAGAEQDIGPGKGLLAAMVRLRGAWGRRFLLLGRTSGGLAAAMAVGDRSGLDAGLQARFRQAGVSHLLVVSGLHLSLLCAVWGVLLRHLLRRPWAVALLTGLGVLAYMLLAGLTVSSIRAGVLALMALIAPLIGRSAYAPASLGLALLVLLAINPYAACDVGLLLSFAATGGVLCFGALDARHFRLRRFGLWGRGLQALGTAAFAAVFTLPVLAVRGTTLSLGTLVCNVLCVPLMLPIMLLAWLFLAGHLVTGSAHLLLTGHVLKTLLRLLEGIVLTAQRVFSLRVGVSGGMAAAILCTAAAAAWLVYHSRLRRWCGVVWAASLLLLGGFSALLQWDAVQVALVGGAEDPTVVISQNGACAVVFRGRRSDLPEIADYLAVHNLQAPQLVVSLADSGTDVAAGQALGRLDVSLRQAGPYVEQRQCLDGVTLTLVRQKGGSLCVIGVQGCSRGVISGPVELADYPACSVFLAGRSCPQGLRAGAVVSTQILPDWLNDEASAAVYAGRQPVVWLHPGRGWRVRGAQAVTADAQSAAAQSTSAAAG